MHRFVPEHEEHLSFEKLNKEAKKFVLLNFVAFAVVVGVIRVG